MAGENINRRLNIYINDKEVVNSLSGITKEMGKTRNELKNLIKGSVDYDKDVARLTKHLSDLRERQEEFTDELKLTNKEMSAAQDNFSNLLGGLAVGDMKAVQEGLMGIRGSIAASSQAAWAFVATPIGAFIAGLMAIGLVTREWAKYNDEVAKTNILVNGITSLSGEELDKVRVRAMALSDYYGQDFKEVLNTAKANVKEFGVSYIEALDSIEDGLVKGGEANGEFLESMREYPTFFATAGYSIRDFQNLVNSGIDLGIYQDKLPDAIKEFALSVNEQTKGVSDALKNAFGAGFTNTLLKGIKDGSITVKEALSLVSEEAKRVGLNAQQAQQLTADLFRGAGEDAGGALKIFEAVRHSIENQIRPLSEAEKATKELADSNLELAEAQDKALKSDGFERWKRNALLAINSVKKGWYDFIANITTSKEDIINAGKKRGAENELKDESNNFKDYMDLRKKRLGAAFDWEKERSEKLADVMKRMNAGWITDVEQKSFDLQISVIKSAKNPVATSKGNAGQPSDADKKGSDDAAKKREKQLADAKKHSEDLKKQLEVSEKDLLATERSFDDLKLANQKDGYDKELALLNEEYSRKIEDTKNKVSQLQEEINKLNADAKSPNNSQDDLALIKATIANKIAAQMDYSSSLVDIEQTRVLKVASIQEKYLQKDIQEQEQATARALQNLQTKHNNELSSITTLEDAKKVLSGYLSEDELKKVNTLEEAKKKIKQEFQNEELTLQQKHLVEMMAQIQAVFEQENIQGIELITPEQREILLKFLDDAAAKLSALGVSKAENGTGEVDASKDIKSLSGIDILGFNPEQWQGAFDNLDTFTEKIAAVELVIGAVKNAFGMYFQFLEAGEKRTMQKFEANNRKKQADLNDQLEKGFITQEVYTARKAKLDADLAKKKAEIEYKQAKREKIMNIASIIGNTAVGVSKALAQGGMLFGVPFAGIVAALGGLQLIAAIAQPLPEKGGFYDGGYTGSGPERNSPGPVHYDEYVVPKKVLFSNDPIVPNIVGYLEAKRTGKNPQMPQEESASVQTNQSTSGGNTMDVAVVNALNRNSLILEKIEEDGLPAYLVNDIKTAKKMRDKIKEVNKLESNAKL
jgi:hypothetical protein